MGILSTLYNYDFYAFKSSKLIMMKKISLFFVLLICANLFNSCSDDDSGPITIDLIFTWNSVHEDVSFPLIRDSDGNDIGGEETANLFDLERGETRSVEVVLDRGGTALELSSFIDLELTRVLTNGIVNDGDTVSWDTINSFATVSGSSSNTGGDEILGRWNQIPTECTNANGDGNFFNFTSSSSGSVFQADCNDICMNGGIITDFNYTISGNSITITPTDVSSCVGEQNDPPSAFTSTWSISGNILTLDGQQFERS
ncbi:hypothetical protein SAMN06265376_105348 [Dokdonia pacifica]|uniref:Lipocalin-like domain-containing protein n=2 Tax=Dokdonia pacifica TaxID=1627892 RepID=A0A239B5P1_9FLAO|nr:hypothetical protein SAMN06265376_105348 [Dokdonia pacifica]